MSIKRDALVNFQRFNLIIPFIGNIYGQIWYFLFYSRTVAADLDPDLENMTDNSLGPISILSRAGTHAEATAGTSIPVQHDPPSKLVIAGSTQNKDRNVIEGSTNVNYGYDQP